MRNTIHALLILVFVGKSFIGFSQNTNTYIPKINNIPSSPEAALLGRFGDIPVGYYTGTAEISVPLYSIKEDGLEIPITLRYHSSGIKVADEATWVGLGWDLSPEGTIIQEVRGKRDDEDNNSYALSNQSDYIAFKNKFPYLNGDIYMPRYQRGYASNNCFNLYRNSSDDDSNEIIYSLLQGYGQPDIYSYNFAGYSGKFYIHPETKQIILIDKKEDIKFEKSDNPRWWTAKTLDGNTFVFSAVETSTSVNANPNIVGFTGATYKMNHIYLKNGKKIDFDYVDEKYKYVKTDENKVLFDFTGGSIDISNSTLFFSKKTLSKITTSDAIIDFNLESREDVMEDGTNTAKKLKKIDIISSVTNRKVKSFEFGYDYFPYNLIGKANYGFVNYPINETKLGKRLRLNYVKEIGYDKDGLVVISMPPHSFEYDMRNTMPLKNSTAIDFWGYYNGQNNDKLLPNLDYFDYPYDSKYQNLDWKLDHPDPYDPIYKNLKKNFSYGYSGADRYTDNNYSGSYMLKKITYPTGGFSEFEYEPNSFTNQFIPDRSKNVYKSILLEDKNTSGYIKSKTFKLSKATTINFENQIFNGKIFNTILSYNYNQMMGSYIELLKINGTQTTTIKKWDLSTVLITDFDRDLGKTWKESVRIEYDPDPNIVYVVNVNLPDNLINNSYNTVSVQSRFNYYDDTDVDTSTSNQCGLRIKSIKNYTQSGSISSNKFIKYYDGKLLNRFEPISVAKAQFNTSTSSQNQSFNYINIQVAYYNRVNITTDDFGVDGGVKIGYGKVEEIELDPSNSEKGIKVFSYINIPNLTKKGLPNIPNLQNGMIQTESTFDKMGNKLIEKVYLYNTIGYQKSAIGFRINNQSFGPTDICGFTINSSLDISSYLVQYFTIPDIGLESKFSFSSYPIISRFYKLETTQTRQFFNGSEVLTTENYTYDTNGKPIIIKSTNSSNEQLQTSIIYNNAPISGIPKTIQKLNASELLSQQQTVYDFIVPPGLGSSLICLPKYILASKGNNPLETKLTYNSYDTKSNVTQYTLENGTQVAIIWGYKSTLPLAKIENATYAQVSPAVANLQTLSDTGTEADLLVALTALRASLPNAMVTTYTHIPLIGVSTITDAKGDKITYAYDAFGRLLNVKDKSNNILSENQYYYKN